MSKNSKYLPVDIWEALGRTQNVKNVSRTPASRRFEHFADCGVKLFNCAKHLPANVLGNGVKLV